MTRMRCPFCKAYVFSDKAAQTISHEAPECSRFTELVEKFGGSKGVVMEIDDPLPP